MAFSILTWWFVIQALSLVGLPLAALLFRTLPDRGYAQAKAFGLLATGYGAWLLAMIGLGSFSAPLLLLVAALVGGLGWYAMRGRGLVLWLRAHWKLILCYEAIFLVALVFMAVLRSTSLGGVIDPDPFGTERPMDFAFFNAIQRSPSFPPHDPWLSGYSINYYYFGYLLVSSVALLSGLQPAVAYNLSLALIFALTALGIAGLVWCLINLTQNRESDVTVSETVGTAASASSSSPVSSLRSPVSSLHAFGPPVAIALAIVMVLLVGNMAGAVQTFLGDERVVALDMPQFLAAMSEAWSGAPTINLPTPIDTDEWPPDGKPDDITTWERKPNGDGFSWWWSSRALWSEQNGTRHYAITEFPAFSFQLGDMHPHILALPYGLLALALAMSLLARSSAPNYTMGRASWINLLLTGLVIGCLYVINSWDLPTYALLYAVSLTLLYIRLADDRGIHGVEWRLLSRQLLIVGVASFVLFAPFYLTFRSFAGGQPATTIPILRTFSGIVGLVGSSRSELHAFLWMFGLALLPVAGFVLAQGRTRGQHQALGIVAQRRGIAGGFSLDALLDLGPWIVIGTLFLGWLIGFQLLFLLPLGLYAIGIALRNPECQGESFALLAGALGCLVCFGTELVYIRDVFNNRMNTIFKFYYQVWLIWGVIGGYGLWWLYSQRFSLKRPGGYLFGAFFAALLCIAAVYPQHTTWKALTEGERTGLLGHTRRDNTPAGAASINWLRTNAPAGAVVLEAVGNSYDVSSDGAAQVAAGSGLPTVLGWPGHEQQWRNGNSALLDEITQRSQDVDTIYSTSDTNQALDLLNKYNVRYVYVGAFERRKYTDPASLAKFDTIAKRAFYQDDVTIYEVP